jgi:RAB protein geranylgeranyltransferase component A
MLTAVYGSSEYAQALSRTGSIFGNIFIVNKDVAIKDMIVD